jgi:hypothetical protein
MNLYNIYYRNFVFFMIIIICIYYIINKNTCSIERLDNSNCSGQSSCILVYQGLPINNTVYTYLGSFNDYSPIYKTIPLRITNSSLINDSSLLPNATNIASSYGATVFGLQNYGNLYIGYDINNAISLGSIKCSDFGGAQCINQVYVASTNYKYTYLGAYIDKEGSRAFQFLGVYLSSIPQVISKFPTFDIKADFNTVVLPVACYVANLYGATVFGLQNNTGEFYIDYDVNRATRYGLTTCSVPLGCGWTNQVYIAKQYRGCN